MFYDTLKKAFKKRNKQASNSLNENMIPSLDELFVLEYSENGDNKAKLIVRSHGIDKLFDSNTSIKEFVDEHCDAFDYDVNRITDFFAIDQVLEYDLARYKDMMDCCHQMLSSFEEYLNIKKSMEQGKKFTLEK